MPRRLTNVQLISTAGVAPEDLAHCLECARPGSVQLEGCTGIGAVSGVNTNSWLQHASMGGCLWLLYI